MAKNKNTVVNRILHTVTDLRVREAQEGEAASRTITGYAILFGVPSAPLYDYDDEEAREVIAPGAVTKELLDGCDIKMTMFHDRQLILARSKNGAGTLTYGVDDRAYISSLKHLTQWTATRHWNWLGAATYPAVVSCLARTTTTVRMFPVTCRGWTARR